jgi:ribosomal protein L31E
MADKKKSEPKIVLEREYTIPLRREWLKVPMSLRGKKAIKAMKEFLVRHMKVYDRDLRKIKIDIYLNNEIRFRGMRKPPCKIKVLAKKYDDGIVKVDLVKLPEKIRFEKLRADKKKKKVEEKVEEKKEEKVEKKEEKFDEKKVEADLKEIVESKEKEETSKEESLKISEEQAKEQKHTTKIQKPETKDMGYKKSKRGR